jgi:hypothetical protein
MKKITLLLLGIIILGTFNSCKKDSPAAALTNPIPYVKVGHKWVYNVTGGFTGFSTITYEYTANNGEIYKMESMFDDTKGTDAFFYYVGGYINEYEAGSSRGANQQWLKWDNVKVGDKWTRVTADETYYHEVMSLDEVVTVPAGTFTCKKIKVTFKNAFNEQEEYYNDTYGLIKEDDLMMSTELASKNF